MSIRGVCGSCLSLIVAANACPSVGTFLASYFYQPATRQVAQMPTTILTVSLLQSAIHAFVTVFSRRLFGCEALLPLGRDSISNRLHAQTLPISLTPVLCLLPSRAGPTRNQ